MMDEGFVNDHRWASASAYDLPYIPHMDQGEDEPMDYSSARYDAEESAAPRSPTGPRMPQAHKIPVYGGVCKTPPASFSSQQLPANMCGSFPALILPGRATASVVSPSRHISRSRQRRRSNSGGFMYPPAKSTVAVDDGGLSAPYTTGNSPPPQSPSSTITLSPVSVSSFCSTSSASATSSTAEGNCLKRNSRSLQVSIRRSSSAERRARDEDSQSPIPMKASRSKSPSILIPHVNAACEWSERIQAQSVPTSPVASGLLGPSPPEFSFGKTPTMKTEMNADSPVHRSQSMRQMASLTPPLLPAAASVMMLPQLPPQAVQQPPATTTTAPYISLVRQPPKQTVYMRILKPYPTVALTIPPDSVMKTQQLFVEASLVRSDNGEDITNCLEGTRVVQVVNMFATFKKLKITVTSQQKNTSFCIRFSLRRYTSSECQVLSECVVTSTPIVVFSHTGYLASSSNAEPARSSSPRPQERHVGPIADTVMVTEVIPCEAQSGARVVIIGSNFKPASRLCVSFNELIVKPKFHEDCALVCNVPPLCVRNLDPLGRMKVDVRVSLDGNSFSKSYAVMYISGPFVTPASQQPMDCAPVP